jgi:hypothetical protein
MVQKYKKMKSQKCTLELSKSFLNEMRAFFRFTEKREMRKVFRIHSIVGLEILRCVALFKKFSKKRETQKTQKSYFLHQCVKNIYSKALIQKVFLFRYIRWRTNLNGSLPSYAPICGTFCI